MNYEDLYMRGGKSLLERLLERYGRAYSQQKFAQTQALRENNQIKAARFAQGAWAFKDAAMQTMSEFNRLDLLDQWLDDYTPGGTD